jgi:DNA mismatch repair ATPase MutL
MLKALAVIAGLTFAGTAAAQYKWTDQNGRVQYGDAPPSGVNAAPMTRGRPSPSYSSSADAESAENKEDAKKPLTAAEQDAEFRKRRQAAEKERQKQAKAQEEADDRRDNCARAREYTRTLDGGRVVRSDAKGENYYLDDAQIAQERARAQQIIRESCN